MNRWKNHILEWRDELLYRARALGDLIMPRTCVVCGRTLGLRERHLCLACAADLPYTRNWLQAHNPLADRFNAVLERHRGIESMDYAYAAALMIYKGDYRNIPRALKYHENMDIGRFYGTLLGRRLAAAPHFQDVDLVIPVPLHWTRRRSRGYNQAEILARAIADAFASGLSHPGAAPAIVMPGAISPPVNPGATSYPVIPGSTGNLIGPATSPACRPELLIRSRRTRTQTRLSVEQKARNVASAFLVPEHFPFHFRLRKALFPRQFQGVSLEPDSESPREILASARHILLVDDTFTTGATLYACYSALRPYTSARISVATLAAVEGTPSGGL